MKCWSFAILLLHLGGTLLPFCYGDNADHGSENKPGRYLRTKEGGKKGGKKGGDKTMPQDKPNVLWLLIDDVSTERFPEYGNAALEGLLPGLEELKADGAVYYSHFYSPSSLCAPSQVALFSGMDPADIGGHHQFANDVLNGKADYFTVPPPEVEFTPEKLRSLGYYSTGAGKLDYQVGEVMPTFYNKILGGAGVDIQSIMEQAWQPAIDLDRPFFSMLNMMDNHQFSSTLSSEIPIPITDSLTGRPVSDLPFAQFGFTPPLGLLYPGPNGTVIPQVTARQDLLATDILGYRGAFDETTLSYEDGSLPGYLPNDIGIKSILAREYDLLRNIDYRIKTVVRRLKELGVYDNTMIVIFGDHGSGNYKAKGLLQPQSIRTPLWIKYPKDMELPKAVEKNSKGELEDSRMTGITDLYPTTLSVIGQAPEPYMTGRAVAGPYEDTSKEREVMFAIISRLVDSQGFKGFAAFTKEHFYLRHLLTEEAINDREATGLEDPAVIAEARIDSTLESRVYSSFPASPLYDRVQKLMLQNALNATYPAKFKQIAANDLRPPTETLFDLAKDPDGTNNLIVKYNFHVGLADDVQRWGTKVTNVTLSYGPVDESGLSKKDSKALKDLRKGLDEWIKTQKYMSAELDWSEGLWGEENKMARQFWPKGVQPLTKAVEVMDDGTLSSETPGTVIRYSAVTPEERSRCERIGTDIKQANEILTPFNSNLEVVEYTSIRNGKTYRGFLYGPTSGRALVFQNFVGERGGCSMFLSEDATFLELRCPAVAPLAFDSRDSTWDGTQWVGVDPSTGEWTGKPVTLFDKETNTWNFAAFQFYMYGPLRNQVFSGLNPDGTPFVPSTPRDRPANKGFPPAPFYWGNDADPYTVPPLFNPAEGVAVMGYSVNPVASFYRAENSPNLDDKGSFSLGVLLRIVSPPNIRPGTFSFESFDYECLLWEVGNEVNLETEENETLHLFTQGVRKGYADSAISEVVIS